MSGTPLTPNTRAEHLFDRAKKLGMINHTTGDGAPSIAMVIEMIIDAERDTKSHTESEVWKQVQRLPVVMPMSPAPPEPMVKLRDLHKLLTEGLE